MNINPESAIKLYEDFNQNQPANDLLQATYGLCRDPRKAKLWENINDRTLNKLTRSYEHCKLHTISHTIEDITNGDLVICEVITRKLQSHLQKQISLIEDVDLVDDFIDHFDSVIIREPVYNDFEKTESLERRKEELAEQTEQQSPAPTNPPPENLHNGELEEFLSKTLTPISYHLNLANIPRDELLEYTEQAGNDGGYKLEENYFNETHVNRIYNRNQLFDPPTCLTCLSQTGRSGSASNVLKYFKNLYRWGLR